MVKICSRCIHDENTPGISFDSEGVCNYCRMHEQLEAEYPVGAEGQKKLSKIAEKIKRKGGNRRYDCVVGVSGGCDSSYLLYKTKELGLRPLAVHFDNNWNTLLAEENLRKIVKKLNVDFISVGVDDEEYNDIYRSFLKASVQEIDAPSDIALTTVLYLAADAFGVKYILNGHSFRTEGITPIGWIYVDGKYIQSIQKQFGSYELKTYPNLWLSKWLKWLIIKRIKRVRPLYYIDYQKEETKKFLKKEFGWEWYGGHHMENKFTCFNGNYYLPIKYNVDLRFVEFSALIRSGQMTREEALRKIQEPPPFDYDIIQEVKKRLGFTDEEFDEIMSLPQKTYRDYKTYKQTFERFRWFFWLMYKFDLVPKSFYMKYTR